MINVAKLSFWHVHADEYTNYAVQHPGVKVVSVWDEVAERGERKAKELGVPFCENLDMVLNNPDVHAVIVDCPTNLHHDVISRAIKAKKHVFTEKVITPNYEEALEISNLVDEHQVEFTVSLPRIKLWFVREIMERVVKGEIGGITSTRIRDFHDGALSTDEKPNGWLPEHFFSMEQCCGGALMDLGCHAVYITRSFLGMPDHVYSAFGYYTGREVEDNSTTIFHYDSGAIGTIEVGFVNSKSPFSIEVHGSDGYISYASDINEVRVTSIHHDPITIREADVADGPISDFEQWVQNIEDPSKAQSNIQLGLELTKMIEACYQSQKVGGKVQVD